MFDEKVLTPSQFPLEDRNRKSTDVCCAIISVILPIIIFIVAVCNWNKDNFNNKFFSFNSNGSGAACKTNQVVFSAFPDDYSKAQCLAACPPNYDASSERLCLPTNADKRAEYLSNPNVSSPFDYYNFKQTLLWSSLFALGVGLFWLFFSFCFPRLAPIIAHVFAALTLLTLGILVLVLWDSFWAANLGLKITLAVFCFLIAIILIVMLCLYANERKFQGYMLDYAKTFLIERPLTFFYIPVFILFGVGLVALFIWQHACFSSAFGSGNNFFNLASGGFWSVLNVLEFIWGLRFLRDAFNFCVSGNSTDWYWNRAHKSSCYSPYQRLISNHWGSVVGGSFLNAFLTIPTLIVELLVCHPQACCSSLGTTCYNSCSWFSCLFDLVRTDAYSYINMSGIPFCDSARQVKKINERNPSFIGSHSPMFHYRFAVMAFLVPITLLGSWFILRARVYSPNFWHWFILIIAIYGVLCYFVNILADAAEGLQTSFLAERELENGNYKMMEKLMPSLKIPLEGLERRMHGEADGYL